MSTVESLVGITYFRDEFIHPLAVQRFHCFLVTAMCNT